MVIMKQIIADFDHYLKNLDIILKIKVMNWVDMRLLIVKKFHLLWTLVQVLIKNFLQTYQAGALSFEILSNGKKLICNSGLFSKPKSSIK